MTIMAPLPPTEHEAREGVGTALNFASVATEEQLARLSVAVSNLQRFIEAQFKLRFHKTTPQA